MLAFFVCRGDTEREISLGYDFRLLPNYAIFEIRCGQYLTSARSELGIYGEHSVENVQALLRDIFNEEFQGYFLMNCESVVSFYSQIIALSPVLLWRSP